MGRPDVDRVSSSTDWLVQFSPALLCTVAVNGYKASCTVVEWLSFRRKLDLNRSVIRVEGGGRRLLKGSYIVNITALVAATAAITTLGRYEAAEVTAIKAIIYLLDHCWYPFPSLWSNRAENVKRLTCESQCTIAHALRCPGCRMPEGCHWLKITANLISNMINSCYICQGSGVTGLGGNWEWKHHIESEANQAALVWTYYADKGNTVEQTKKTEVRGTWAKGRARMRWMDNIRHDMNKSGLEEAGRRP